MIKDDGIADTVNVWALEVPPLAAGFTTVMLEVPTEAISAALIVAVRWLAETNVVVRAEPFQSTVEEAT